MDHESKPDEENFEHNNDENSPHLHDAGDEDDKKASEPKEAPGKSDPTEAELDLSQLGREYLPYQYQKIKKMGNLVIESSKVIRQPELWINRPENNNEHTQMLGEVVQHLAEEYFPHLSISKIRSMADLHDKIEIYTGDVSTYGISEEGMKLKKQKEKEAMKKLLPELSPKRQKILVEYEEQKTDESRFVRLVDKLMPYLVDDLGAGAKVLRINHGVDSVEKYQSDYQDYSKRLRAEYPEPDLELIHDLIDISSARVAKALKDSFEEERREEELDELAELMSEPGIDPSSNH